VTLVEEREAHKREQEREAHERKREARRERDSGHDYGL
jgi:hypothetical protein